MTTRGGPGDDDVWVGLDLGTQSVRAVAATRHGEVVGTGRSPLTSTREGPRHEQDPEQWWQAVVSSSRQALSGVRSGAVRAVAVDATSGTVLLTDTEGRAVSPALMYDDTRAVGELDRVNQVGEAVWTELGYLRMQPSWALPKLLWLLREYPGVGGRARLAHQSDFVNRRLVGSEVPTDLSNALKTGAHLIEEAWPTDVFDALGVPAHVLPDLVRPGTYIGQIGLQAAEVTGLPCGTPVIAGMTDSCAAQLGAGAVSPGNWNCVLGTTLALKGVTKELVRDPLGAVYSHRAPDGTWLPGGASSTGAGVISRDFHGRDLAELDGLAARHEPAAVVAYPLARQGERFPFVAPQAEGFSLGAGSSEAECYAAILQGVGFIERLCFDYLDLLGADVSGELTFTGGASRSRYWCQLRADILGRTVKLPDNTEPALGMAVLAASHRGRTAEVAKDMVRIRETIEPRPGSTRRFDDSYLDLVDELERRGWLKPVAAAHARERTKR